MSDRSQINAGHWSEAIRVHQPCAVTTTLQRRQSTGSHIAGSSILFSIIFHISHPKHINNYRWILVQQYSSIPQKAQFKTDCKELYFLQRTTDECNCSFLVDPSLSNFKTWKARGPPQNLPKA